MSVRRMVSGSGSRTFQLMFTFVVSVLLTPFIIHSAGDRPYGLWTLVANLVGYSALLDLGFSGAVNRFIAGSLGSKDLDSVGRYFSTAATVLLTLGVTAFALSAIVALVLSRRLAPSDVHLAQKVLLILGLNCIVAFPGRAFVGLLEADFRFPFVCWIEITGLTIRSIAIIAFLKAGWGIVGLAVATLGASSFNFGFYFLTARRFFPGVRWSFKRASRSAARDLISYGSVSVVARVADILRFQVDGLVIAFMISVSAVTHFKVAGQLNQFYIDGMLAIMGVLTPWFSQKHGAQEIAKMEEGLIFATRLSIYFASFVAFILIVFGKVLIGIWMGNAYQDAYPCLVFLAIGSMVALWQFPSVAMLYGTSKHRYFALANLVEGVSNLGLSLFLAKRMGIAGVAAGTMIPMALVKLTLQPWYVSSVLGLDPRKYWRNIGASVGMVSLVLVPMGILATFLPLAHFGVLSWAMVASFGIYATFVWRFAISPGDKITVGNLLTSREKT